MAVLIFGLLIWVFGYLTVGRIQKSTGFLYDQSFVRPPFLIYLICGMPKARNIPKGIMAVSSLALQLQGLFLIIYWLSFRYLPISNIFIQGTIFIAGIILNYLYSWYLYKQNYYKID